MSNYTVNTDFLAIDALAPGDPGKKILGTAWSAEFDEIETVIATKADKADPTFTGTAALSALVATTLTGTDLHTAQQLLLSSPVAFLARVEAVTPSANAETIPFATEVFDYGSGYDASTYVFTAPYTGVYALQAHADLINQFSTGLVQGYIYMLHNATQVAKSNVVMTPSGAAADLNFGCTVSRVIKLTAGDTITVKYTSVGSGGTFWTLAACYFSGILLTRT